MSTRQLTAKEIALLLFLLAVVSLVQAEFTYTHLARAQAWSIAGIFALVYAFIGGAFGIATSSRNSG
jgi:hypothetical protein